VISTYLELRKTFKEIQLGSDHHICLRFIDNVLNVVHLMKVLLFFHEPKTFSGSENGS